MRAQLIGKTLRQRIYAARLRSLVEKAGIHVRRPPIANFFMLVLLLGTISLLAATTTYFAYFAPFISLWLIAAVGTAFIFMLTLAAPAPSARFARGMFLLLGVYIFILILWPRYAFFSMPGLPGISPPRFFLAILLWGWWYALLKSSVMRGLLVARLKEFKVLLYLVAAYLLLKIASIANSEIPFLSAKGVMNELLTVFLPLLITLTLVRDIRDARIVFSIIIVAAFLVAALGVYESLLGRNLFIGILQIDSEYLQEVFREKIRGGSYRIQSTFSHPLTLAEFLAVSVPVSALLLLGRRFTPLRFVSYLLFSAFIFYVIYQTGSRSGLGGFLLAQFMVAIAATMRGTFHSRSVAGSVMLLLATLVLVAAAIFAIYWVSDDLIGRNARELHSSMARLEMWNHGLRLAFESPLLGYGQDMAASVLGFVDHGGAMTIDSYYLSVLLEAGFPGLFVYLSIITYLLYLAIRSISLPGEGALVAMLLGVSVFVFAIIKSILSLSHNHGLMMILIGIMLVGISLARQSNSDNGSPQRIA